MDCQFTVKTKFQTGKHATTHFTFEETGPSHTPTVSGALHTEVPTNLSGSIAVPSACNGRLTPKSQILISSKSPKLKMQESTH